MLAKSTFVTLENISPLLSWMIFLVTMNLLFYICMRMQCVHDFFMSLCVSVDAHMPQHGDHLTPQEPCSLTSMLVKADSLLFTPEYARLVLSQAPMSDFYPTIETLAHCRHSLYRNSRHLNSNLTITHQAFLPLDHLPSPWSLFRIRHSLKQSEHTFNFHRDKYNFALSWLCLVMTP